MSLGLIVFSAGGFAGQVDVQLDGAFDMNLTPPYVGSGSFTFSIDPGDGTHPLSSFGVYDSNFTLGSATFTTGHMTTTPGTVLVILGTNPWGRTLHFSNTAAFGDGDQIGAVDFTNGSDFLSFEPPGYGGILIQYIASSANGTYGAVPEPATWFSLLGGLSLLYAIRRRRAA